MSRKRKTKGPKPTPAPAQARPQIDPETGLPPVGQGLPPRGDELDRVLRRARAKHTHRQGYRR